MADSAQKLKYSTIRTYLHGVATTQVELGFSTPLSTESMVWRMLKGIKRVQGASTTKVRLPITTSILSQLEQFQDISSPEGLCVRAAMWLGTTDLLRSGEFAWRSTLTVVLKRNALSFHASDERELPVTTQRDAIYMKVRLTQSKTDPFRVGMDIIVSNPSALTAMHDYLEVRKGGTTEPLFIFAQVSNAVAPLSVSELVTTTQRLLTKAKILNPQLYLGHSFRKGGATSLHEAGETDSLIKTMGRWRSFAFATYVSTSLQLLVRAGQQMTGAPTVPRKVDEPWDMGVWE